MGSGPPGLFGPYTKVNRCLTEGRRGPAIAMAGIEGGIECTKLAPLLAPLAAGTAGPDEVAALEPHLTSCLNCRARLRALRTAEARQPLGRGRTRLRRRVQGTCERSAT